MGTQKHRETLRRRSKWKRRSLRATKSGEGETKKTEQETEDKEMTVKEVLIIHCPECKKDAEIACPRDVDAECLHCGLKLCGRHILTHLKEVHLVSLTWTGFKRS